ncbi:hypothetical protein HWV62_45559 [Athelia sp. TMB]|nr:hypothetical protein HWV62_45559 [Athelia sp. TMB]
MFWATWAVYNICLTIVFGVLHQGGVVPSLFYMHDQLAALNHTQSARLIYWKTYMPPWHLLAIQEAGASAIVLQGNLADAAASSSGETNTTTYVITTFAMKASLPPAIERCLTFEHAMFPHLDLDHIGESVKLGWKGGLSLGIWIVDMMCIERSSNLGDALPLQIE